MLQLQMLILVVFGVAAATAVYFYYWWSLEYWPRRGVPTPPPEFFFGHSRMMYKLEKPRVLQYRDWGKLLGKTFGLNEGLTKTLVSSDLDVVQEIMCKQFDNFYTRRFNVIEPPSSLDQRLNLFQTRGGRWKRIRTIATPSFSVSSLKKIRPIVEDSAMNMVKLMGERHSDGQTFDILEFFMEYTMDTICRLVMGQKESKLFQNHRVGPAKALFMINMDHPFVHVNLAMPVLNAPSIFLVNHTRNSLTKPQDELFDEIGAVVESRLKFREEHPAVTNEGSEDFIDVFLDTVADYIANERNNNFKNSETVEKALTVPEIIAQAVIFLLGGFDTTANGLGYTAWLLSKHPEVMKRCQEEVDDVCTDENISFEDLNNCRYIEATCKEVLRFFPLGTFACTRICTQTTDVCGMKIEEGTAFQADVFNLHFDKEIWGEDANEFMPERWLDPSRPTVPSIAYLPFGGGPRICIGMRLGMLKMKMVITHVLRKFSIVNAPEAKQLQLQGSLTLTSKEVLVKIIPRE